MISRILGIGYLTSICLPTAWAADCPNRQPGQHLEFLGRSADNSYHYGFQVQVPGVIFASLLPGYLKSIAGMQTARRCT